MYAEARALSQGVELCRRQGLVDVDIEMDSMVLSQILQNKAKIPWVLDMRLGVLSKC